ncbi:hypothetical protein K505DRAFT_367300 [Melanomma pulvis-pyrius CBS 109.77]|uniref:Uncharacterized protein n=1 Tax=Melanomma pulvis-pyrius CBS 109.77 TaxID=1314802 RepID=A0A6A6WTS9_9PLEO|nr:hypothetical protein K505DRAFT_367300 [Melanomma pulvis-pyrius CBS 109.77]
MNSTEVGNHFYDHGVVARQCCASCIAFYKDHEYRFLGTIGCLMANPVTRQKKELFREWRTMNDKGQIMEYKRCYRCFVTNQECVSLPDELRGDLPAVHQYLENIRACWDRMTLPAAQSVSVERPSVEPIEEDFLETPVATPASSGSSPATAGPSRPSRSAAPKSKKQRSDPDSSARPLHDREH